MGFEKYKPSPKEMEKPKGPEGSNAEELSQEERELTQNIAGVSSFEELISVIEEVGEIEDSTGHVKSAEEIKKIIEGLRSGAMALIHFISRKNGLREAVVRLLEEEKNS